MIQSIVRTEKDLKEFLSKFNTKQFAFDTETTSLSYMNLKIEGMSLADGKYSCYIHMADYMKGYINKEFARLNLLLTSLFDNAELIIGHNVVYDLKVLHKEGIMTHDKPELYCTMVGDHLIDENRLHGLKYLADTVLGKREVTAFTEIEDHSSDQFFIYAIHDAEWTWELAQYQIPILKEEGTDRLMRDIEMPFQYVLRDMEINGMLVDVDKVRATQLELQKYVLDSQVEIFEMLNKDYTIKADGTLETDLNLNSSQQVGKILFEELKLPVLEVTPGGKPKVGQSVLDKLKDKHPFVEKLLFYKKVTKLLNAYFGEDSQIIANLDSDGRVRPSFRDTGTTTGRLSCSKPNLQQLPKLDKNFPIDTRQCFVVPDGKTMITCDYSGQELRVLTEITQEPVLIDTFNKGKDMHLSTANDFFNLGIPEEALYEESKLHGEYKEKFYSERNKAKTINFGMAYGKGAYGFSKDFNISEEEAQEILDKYFAALPKVKEAIDNCHDHVRDHGWVASMTGRRRHFDSYERYGKRMYNSKSFRQSFNFLIQGFSADMIRIAMNKVRELGKEHKEWDIRVIATVHDEAVYEVNSKYVEEASKGIKETFEGAVRFCVPVVSDIGKGKNYSQAK